MSVSQKEDFAGAVISIDPGTSEETIRIHTAVEKDLKKAGAKIIGPMSASLELCRVASGEIDGFVHRRLAVWDVAGGVALLRAAGGVVTHLNGAPKDIFTIGTVAANPALHAKLLASIAFV